jgi:hypothetical protein
MRQVSLVGELKGEEFRPLIYTQRASGQVAHETWIYRLSLSSEPGGGGIKSIV